MGLETATFLSGLNTAWPPSGDPKAQGDDHIRLLKSTLVATFPTATRAFYFPTATSGTANVTLVAADQNRLVQLDTTAGGLTVTLPSLTSGDAGWECEIVKSSSDVNAILVSAASGNITSQAGATATIRIGQFARPARFKWSGTLWWCFKPYIVGESINWDGSVVPPGFMTEDGSTFSGSSFAELAAVLAQTTLFDKRGRVEAGEDGGTGRLTTAGFGANNPTRGLNGGAETVQLTAGLIPTITAVSGSTAISVLSTVLNVLSSNANVGNSFVSAGGNAIITFPNGTVTNLQQLNSTGAVTVSTSSNNTGGSAPAHPNMQPTTIVKKLVVAC
jgi:hypothetical protein